MMLPNRNRLVSSTALLAAACVVSCNAVNNQKTPPMGRAVLGVSIDALSAASVQSMSVNVKYTAGGLSDINDQLFLGNQGWTGVIGEIPIGSEQFTVHAFDGANLTGNDIYDGVTTVTITEGATADIIMVLQENVAQVGNPYNDTAPEITAVTASSNAVGPGDKIQLNVTAHDAASEALTYAWSDNSGTANGAFSSTIIDDPTWTAPATPNAAYLITITVSDPSGAFAAVTLDVSDLTTNQTGQANFVISFNTWPTVTNVSAAPARVALGGSTFVGASATDADNDDLDYAWSDNCTGTFTPTTGSFPVGSSSSGLTTTANSITWTAPAVLPMGVPTDASSGTPLCTLTVTVTDYRSGNPAGGTNTGTITIQVGNPITAAANPIFTASFQSDGGNMTTTAASVGETITMNVTASNPQGGALTWGWAFTPPDGTSTLGSVGNGEVDTATTSTNTFIIGTGSTSYTVTATATDPVSGLSTGYPFKIYVQ